MSDHGRTLMLLDVYALVYRAFFALPPLTAADGQPANAVYGFERMLNRVLSDERPTHVVACFDAGIPAQRLTAVPEYKANRPETPDDLSSQFPLVRRVLAARHIPVVEVEGEEADDCIATLAGRASSQGVRTIIVSGDLDLLQLVDKHVTVVVTRRGISDMARYDEAAVRERYGLPPSALPDYRGLKGDPSDNLPGVPGIGEKTAAKLIAQYGSLDELLAHANEVTPKRIADLLAQHADKARATRDVSIANRRLPIELDLDQARVYEDPAERNVLFAELGFRSLVTRSSELGSDGARGSAGPPSNRPGFILTRPAAEPQQQQRASGARAAVLETIATQYGLVTGQTQALELLARAQRTPEIAVCALPELASWRDAEPIGFALARAPGIADVLPSTLLLHDRSVRDEFRGLLASGASAKIVHGAKAMAGWLSARGLALENVAFDAQIAYGLLDSGKVDPSLTDTLAFAGAGEYTQLSRAQQTMDLFAPPPALEATHASAADLLLRASFHLRTQIETDGMTVLLRDVEQPLASVLAGMERAGFRLDLDELARIRAHLDAVIAETTAAIFQMAGSEFNINSPKALGELLFEKLGLQHSGKTKTGYATGIDVLAPLAAENPIVTKVLEYREVSKLKSTYVDALPALVDQSSGLLHTTLHQLGAATGRLSSSDPNLQNIPIRSAVGREIRRAFRAPTPGQVLLTADYSQVELRLFAHLADDPNLIDAFVRGEDIHEFAARAVFGISAGTPVSAEMRRRAKAVNFGILYGQGEVGLAQSVGFSREEARQFMGAYFSRFPRVRDYIDSELEQARDFGYTTTMLGRRRLLPDLRSRNYGLRAAAERMSINAPLQGSAADLIKIAMVRAARALVEQDVDARLVLQVHDELIFETTPADLARVRSLAKEAMEQAMTLRVPLVVEFKSGPSWGEAQPEE